MGRQRRFKSALVALVASFALVVGLVPAQALAEAADELAAGQSQAVGVEAAAPEASSSAGDAEKGGPAVPSEADDSQGAEDVEPGAPPSGGADAQGGETGQAAPAEPAPEPTGSHETVSEAPYPALDQSMTVNGVTVRISASEGVFPEGAQLSVAAVPSAQVESAVAAEREADANVAASYTVDIKVLDADGREMQPKDGQAVNVSFAVTKAADANLDAQIYHISGGNAEALDTTATGQTVSAETTGFSLFTVEFTYNDLQYILPGGKSVALSEILDTVGLVGEPAEASSSAPELFSVETKDGVWTVTARKAFSSTETLSVTINGTNYEISVTDDDSGSSSDYPLWVGGVQVTSANKGDILGDGTASFDPDSNTLTLNNADITGVHRDSNIYVEGMDLTISLIGSNSLSGGSQAIEMPDSNLSITGGGSLTASGTVNVIYTTGNLKIDGCVISATATGNNAIRPDGDLTITDSSVTVTADGYYGLYCSRNLKISGDSRLFAKATGCSVYGLKGFDIEEGIYITTPAGGYVDGPVIKDSDRNIAKSVIIERPVITYPLWVGGVQVTSANKGDILGDGTVSFDPASNTLTLTNANITAASSNKDSRGMTERNVVYARGLALKVSLSGDNTLGDGSADRAIVSDEGSLAITGGGSLTAASGRSSLQSVHGSISITGSTVIATSSDVDGIFADRSITITDSTVTATGGRYGITALLGATISGTGSSVTASGGNRAISPTSGVTLNDGLAYIEGSADAAKAVIEGKRYSITIEGGTADVSEAKAGDTVTITADEPEEGMIFNQWALSNTDVDFQATDAWQTTFTMPAHDVTIEAVFRNIVINDTLPDVTYTGEAIEPTFSFFGVQVEGAGALWPGSSYSLSYEDNVDVGEAKVILTVTDNRKGSKTVTFNIKPADISEATVEAIDQTYAGAGLKPAATVTWHGRTLEEGKDYTLSTDGYQAGDRTLTVTGTGNFKGAATEMFKITPRPLTITASDQTCTYNGQIQGEGDTAYEDPVEIADKVTVKGLQGDDALTSIVLDGQGKDANEYDLMPSGAAIGEATGNYTITYTPGKLTIEPKKATITVDDASKASGTGDPVFTGTVDGLVAEGDLGEVTYSRTNTDEAVGTYKGVLTASYEANPNYDVTVVPGDFTIKQTYTVRWLDGDGSVLQTKTYAEGDPVPTYTGEEPTKAPTAQYSYAFTGWDEGTADGTTTTYKPLFDEEVRSYAITFDLAGGTLDGQSGTVTWTREYGSTITLPKPTRDGYAFLYWKGSRYEAGDVYTVEGGHSFTAVWEETPSPDPTPTPTTDKPSPAPDRPSTKPLPQTGDPYAGAAALAVALALASGLCLVAAGLSMRRRRGRHAR